MTILNQTASYALRAMTVLARLAPGESIRGMELAERTQTPPHYLGKVMRRLVLAGLVRGRKGRGGGFALNRPPPEITFHDILDAVDVAPEQGLCAFNFGNCDPDRPCPLHGAWSTLQGLLGDWATTTTLDQTRQPPAAAAGRSR